MTARRLPPREMPDWPRLMRADLAAAYVGVGRETFDKEVREGVWPKPRERRVRGAEPIKTWDRRELDAAVDRLGAAGKPTGPSMREAAAGAWGRSP